MRAQIKSINDVNANVVKIEKIIVQIKEVLNTYLDSKTPDTVCLKDKAILTKTTQGYIQDALKGIMSTSNNIVYMLDDTEVETDNRVLISKLRAITELRVMHEKALNIKQALNRNVLYYEDIENIQYICKMFYDECHSLKAVMEWGNAITHRIHGYYRDLEHNVNTLYPLSLKLLI